ncbi:amino acid permease [Lacimicrobium alkaliphilum]|uniref:Na-K-Cl cotransporter n=1 Tax=Lacimicrobium alkaliphilum TaxID=1526571 RepID=A0ABQ1RRV2_9ALTE|nr:amino acid permease [Lacimicrobium alkaliphilum]GGD78243.1 Na-K-Cl cotransporter [Lacimicrobium alkaliphilum]
MTEKSSSLQSDRLSTHANPQRHLFGTFGGVFTPSILTIVGIILFLRTGYIVGEVGLAQTLIIMTSAFVICLLTGLSLAVIATDTRVKEGGFYYVISRSLGPPFGGALGLTLFLSISISVAFYVMGLVEVLNNLLSLPDWLSPRLLASGVILTLFVFAWLGADWTTKLQYLIMGLVAFGLLSFFIGGSNAFSEQTLAENWTKSGDTGQFWLAFALFFPAITGFTQGLNMSGDLKVPHKAIPLGTFTAIGLSVLLYLMVALVLAGAVSTSRLSENYYIMADVSVWPSLVAAAVIAATLSSGMASMLGAPRVLQAMGDDRLIPFLAPFAKGEGKDNNPRRAVFVSAIIALACVIIGDLNLLAPIISMFFLAAYALLNYATFFALNSENPFFRPRFRWSHKTVSLLGGIGCVAAMLAINFVASMIALAVLFGLHQYLARSHQHLHFTDHQRGAMFKRIRELLFEMNRLEPHPGDWRPHMLVFSKNPDHHTQLLKFSAILEGQSGLTTLTRIINTDDANEPDRQKVLDQYHKAIDDAGIRAFSLVTQASDFRSGLRHILHAYGIGPIRANTAVIHWTSESVNPNFDNRPKDYAASCQEVIEANMNLVALASYQSQLFEPEEPSSARQIDIWWRGGPTARLMLMFAYLCTRSNGWQHTRLRILTEAEKYSREQVQDIFSTYLDQVRIEAEVEALDNVNLDIIKEYSGESDLVFFPIKVSECDIVDDFDVGVQNLVSKLNNLALMQACESMQLDPDPDNGNNGGKDGERG